MAVNRKRVAIELQIDGTGMSDKAIECAMSSECVRRYDEREDTLIDYIDRKYAKPDKRSRKKTKPPRFFD